MSDYPMLISNKLHSFRNFWLQIYRKYDNGTNLTWLLWTEQLIVKPLIPFFAMFVKV